MALNQIALPLHVQMLDLQVTRRAMEHLLSLDRGFPSMPDAIKSSMNKESFCRCGCRLAVLSSRDKLLSLNNVRVCKIQEGVIHADSTGGLFEKRFPEHPISSF